MTIKLANPADQRKGPNCGVTAVAIASGVSFARAWNAFKAVNPRTYGKRWKGGTYTTDQKKVLDRLGVGHETYMPKGTRGPLYRFVDQFTAKDAVYMVTTGSHVQIVCNGTVADQSGVKPIAEFWGRRKIVKNVIRITTPFKHAAPAQPKHCACGSRTAGIADGTSACLCPSAKLPPMAQPAASSLFPALFPTQAPAPAECQLALF